MRMKLAIVFLTLSVGSAVAQQQQRPAVSESVTLYNFNPKDNTYGADINITATPCPGVAYKVDLMASGVKSAEEAKAKVKAQIDKVTADIDAAAEKCGKP